MKVRVIIVVACLFLLGLFGVAARGRFSAELASAKADADSARAVAASAVVSAKAAETFAAANQLLVANAQAETDSAKRKAAVLEQLLKKARTGFQVVADAAPDTCAPVIAAANAALAASDSLAGVRAAALASSEKAREILQASVDSLRASAARLVPATVTLSAATLTLERKSQPSFFTRIKPRVGFGLAAGADALGQPHLIAGMTLGWTL